VDKKGKAAYGKAAKPIKADIEWTAYIKNFEKVSRENLIDSLSESLLQLKPAVSTATIKSSVDESSRESFIKTATIQLMSIPEYQMC